MMVSRIDSSESTVSSPQARILPFLIAAVSILAAVALNWETARALAANWLLSGGEYQHGVLLIAASGYLLWRQRADILSLTPVPVSGGLWLVGLISLVLWAAYVVHLQAVQWAALFLVVPALVWTILGSQVLLASAFPLALPFLALPIWEVFHPLLQDLTTSAAVVGLRLSGVPVAADGYKIEIPGGVFRIAAYCGGLRYVLAAVSLGLIVGYLNSGLLARRIMTAAIFLVAGIVLNWVRVYIIIMTGYVGGMEHPLVSDHRDFGWVVFAVGLIPVYLLASRLRDREDDNAPSPAPAAGSGIPQADKKFVVTAAGAILLMLSAPLGGLVVTALQPQSGEKAIVSVPGSPRWTKESSGQEAIRGVFLNADAEYEADYVSESQRVSLYMALYSEEAQGKEVINDNNTLYDRNRWRRLTERTRDVPGRGTPNLRLTELRVSRVGHPGESRLVWSWFNVGGYATSDIHLAKMRQVWNALTGRRGGAAVILSTEISSDASIASSALQRFLEDMSPEIDKALKTFFQETVTDGTDGGEA